MNKSIFVLLVWMVSLYMVVTGFAATTTGTITADETWSGTVTLTGDVEIVSGTVTISPGTIIKFAATNDNKVEGKTNQIALLVKKDGALYAVGTASQMITFTSDAKTPSSWFKIRFSGLNNDAATALKYCIFEYGSNGVTVENTDVTTSGPSDITMENCIVRHMGAAGVYAQDESDITIKDCTFHNCDIGVWFAGTKTTKLINTLMYDIAGSGIILVNNFDIAMNVTIDHVTMYGIDGKGAGGFFAYGWGIYHDQHPNGTSNITNTIMANKAGASNTLIAGITMGQNWTVNNDYNTIFNFGTSVQSGTIGSNSTVLDPLFTDAANADFTLTSGSPAKGTSNDGGDMGVVFSSVTGIDDFLTGVHSANIHSLVFSNPVTSVSPIIFSGLSTNNNSVLYIHDANGKLVKKLDAAPQVMWDGTDTNGQQVKGGVYVYSYDGSKVAGKIVYIK